MPCMHVYQEHENVHAICNHFWKLWCVCSCKSGKFLSTKTEVEHDLTWTGRPQTTRVNCKGSNTVAVVDKDSRAVLRHASCRSCNAGCRKAAPDADDEEPAFVNGPRSNCNAFIQLPTPQRNESRASSHTAFVLGPTSTSELRLIIRSFCCSFQVFACFDDAIASVHFVHAHGSVQCGAGTRYLGTKWQRTCTTILAKHCGLCERMFRTYAWHGCHWGCCIHFPTHIACMPLTLSMVTVNVHAIYSLFVAPRSTHGVIEPTPRDQHHRVSTCRPNAQ